MPRRHKFSFNDLIFTPISPDSRTEKATLTFSNGYGCNIYYLSPNTNRELPYEFELLFNGEKTFHNSISDDNVGYCSKDNIIEFLDIAQKLY